MFRVARHWRMAVVLAGILVVSENCSDDKPFCNAGEEICNGSLSLILVCAGGETWQIKDTCEARTESCVASGAVATCACHEGAEACSTDGRRTIKCDGGAWKDVTSCPAAQTCSVNLVEEKSECILTQLACDPGRDGEACKLISATDATVPAYAPSAYSCAQTGKWELKQACAETQLCLITPAYSTNPDGSTAVVEQAVCTQIPCQEGLEYCPSISGKGNPYVCKDGVMQLKATCSDTQGCVVDPNGKAGCLSFVNTPCTDGAEYCDVSSVARTCVSGAWTTKKVCSATQSCFVSGGLADCQDLCATGTSQCSSTGVVQTCDSDGLWQDATICAPTQECVVYQGVVACRDKV